MKRPYQPKHSKQATAKRTIRLGKEDFESPSPLARHHETTGVSKEQKRVLEHDQGPKKANKKKHKKAHKR